MSTRICVCIANYNGAGLLRDCLDSVFSQQVAAEVEIIVHDDASTDTSLQLLRSEYPSVRLIASDSNVGFCISNNRMAEAATGDYLLLLNNDAALQPGALAALLAEQQRIAAACILTLPQYDWESGVLVDRGCLLDPFYNPVPNLSLDRHDVAYVIGACLWIPRTVWQELGGFPAAFGSIAEDLYLCAAARLRGQAVRCVDASGYRHRQGASFGGNRADGGLRTTYRRRALSERNKTWAMLACTPGWVVWPLLVLHLTLLLAEGAIVSLVQMDARLWQEVYRPIVPSLLVPNAQWKGLRIRLQASRRTTQRRWWRVFILTPRKLTLLWRYGMPTLR
ncbi:glycosyltransferase family 2 protein [Stenotrophomonas koreensis]|nr:glycosyltransferase [Stenotrophomonas koreensis]